MSRLPPVPAASQPAYGPGAVPKNFTEDSAHFTPKEPEFIRGHLQRGGFNDSDVGTRPSFAGDDLGGSVRTGNSSGTLPLLVFGAVVAAIVWLAGKQRR